jgi:hypothetical protein
MDMISVLLTAAIGVAAPGAQTTPAPAPAPACATENHRAYDFWVGKWDVRPFGKPRIVAHSLIEKLYDGCAIRENWMPVQGTGGGSLSNYDATGWHQVWLDASGTRVMFDGAYKDDAMVLTGNWPGVNNGKDALIRMTYTRQPGGAVRQKGDMSADNGVTWTPSFDFLYSPSQ